MKRFLLLSALLLSFCCLRAEGTSEPREFYFRNLSVEDGLSQSSVYDIIQDSRGFMWAATESGVNLYDGNSFRVFKKSNSGLTSDVTCSLTEHSSGLIFVGTGAGLSVYDPRTDKFSDYPLIDRSGETVVGTVFDLMNDSKGYIWAVLLRGGVFCIDAETSEARFFGGSEGTSLRTCCEAADGSIWVAGTGGIFRAAHTQAMLIKIDPTGPLAGKDIWAICRYDAANLLVGTHDGGLYTLDTKSLNSAVFWEKDPDALGGSIIHRIDIDARGRVLVGTETGLFVFSQTGVTHLEYSPADPYSISDNAVYSIFQDNEAGLWIGTYFGGIDYHSGYNAQFGKFYPGPDKYSMKGKSISQFFEDDRGFIWIATEDAGLFCYDPSTGHFTTGYIDAENIHALTQIGDELWIGTYAKGLYRMNLKTKRTLHYSVAAGNLPNDNIYSIYKDRSGRIFIGTISSLAQYNFLTDKVERIAKGVISGQVQDILEDAEGNIWLASFDCGLFRGNGSTWERLLVDQTMPLDLTLDSKYNLWVTTEGDGVFKYDKARGDFTAHYTVESGLPDDVVYKLVPDGQGRLWGSTNSGIFSLDPQSGQVLCFDHQSGLVGDQFNYQSGFRSSIGEIWLGSIKGIVRFNPDGFRVSTKAPEVVINRLQIYNVDVAPGEEGSPLEKTMMFTDRLTLRSSQSVFSIGFTAIDYSHFGTANYFYRLEGLEEEWIPCGNTALVPYSRLAPGRYVFMVKAVSDAHYWDDVVESISIRILPPWYATTVAWIVYLLLAVSALLLIMLTVRGKSRERSAAALAEMEAKKEQELYNSKIEFFTNITHEIRTPLSLITVPMEQVMEGLSEDDPDYENLSIINRNSHRLLKLVNELLDFRKIDTSGTSLNFRHISLVPFIHEIAERFTPSAEIKGVKVVEVYPDGGCEADVDPELLTKMTSNLLNNAYKHSLTYIKVALSVSGNNFILSVDNDGDRIPAGKEEEIFNPFVKLDQNTGGIGVGLPFTRKLAGLHGGTLELDQSGEDVRFVLTLPLHQKDVISTPVEEVAEQEEDAETLAPLSGDRKRILVVEDNREFRHLVADLLRDDYSVMTSRDGEEALERLSGEEFDIVISDVMMPGIDGFELCRRIKTDLEMSHTPVILMTAKTDEASHVTGLDMGADEYLTKPFSPKVLLAVIKNLLQARENMKEKFQNSPMTPASTIVHTSADETFLAGIIEFINAHISEENLDVAVIAEAMHMSRSSLYRKLAGISELSPNDFIRLCRLRKAAELLSENEYRVNEVAYLVGFTSSSYFARCFYKQFGVLPKDYSAK